MQRRRSSWLRIHRWIALGVGWIVASVAVVGATLVVAQPLDRWMHPRLFRSDAPARAAASFETVRRHVIDAVGKDVNLTFRPPREATDTLWVTVGGAWTGTFYFDPSTGAERGRRKDSESVVDVLFKLHSSLLLKDTGKALLAVLALVYLAMLVTGLVLWWPRRWPPSWRIEWRRGTRRALFDLHRTVGAVMGLLIAVSVATGAWMAWRPLGDAVTAVTGGTKTVPPVVERSADAGGPPPALDTFVERAQARFPDAPIGYVQVPGQPGRPVRVRMRLPGDPHPNGLTSVWLHPRTAAVLRVDRWDELDIGTKATSVIYPLHTGELGGPALEAVVFVNGLSLGTLAVTGLWLWWRRRERAPRS